MGAIQRDGAHSSQATDHASAVTALAVAKVKVVPTVSKLCPTEAQAAPVQVCGSSDGKGQNPDTLPTANANMTAKYSPSSAHQPNRPAGPNPLTRIAVDRNRPR